MDEKVKSGEPVYIGSVVPEDSLIGEPKGALQIYARRDERGKVKFGVAKDGVAITTPKNSDIALITEDIYIMKEIEGGSVRIQGIEVNEVALRTGENGQLMIAKDHVLTYVKDEKTGEIKKVGRRFNGTEMSESEVSAASDSDYKKVEPMSPNFGLTNHVSAEQVAEQRSRETETLEFPPAEPSAEAAPESKMQDLATAS